MKKELNLLTTLTLRCLRALKDMTVDPASAEALNVSLQVAALEQSLATLGVSVDVDTFEYKQKTDKQLYKQLTETLAKVTFLCAPLVAAGNGSMVRGRRCEIRSR
jgi:hypothetical protein